MFVGEMVTCPTSLSYHVPSHVEGNLQSSPPPEVAAFAHSAAEIHKSVVLILRYSINSCCLAQKDCQQPRLTTKKLKLNSKSATIVRQMKINVWYNTHTIDVQRICQLLRWKIHVKCWLRGMENCRSIIVNTDFSVLLTGWIQITELPQNPGIL